MKNKIFVCLAFVFAAGMNVQGIAQDDKGGGAGMRLRGLRAGMMPPSTVIMKNHQTRSEKTALSQQWPVEIVANFPSLMMTGDFDNDDDTDVIIQTSDSLFWYENLQPGWLPHYIDTDSRNAGVGWVDVFDMDMDGDPDVFQSFGTNPGTIMWFENKLNGMQWQKHIISNSLIEPANMPSSLGDIDSDNDIDVVVATFGDGKILWFENVSGDTTWKGHHVSNIGSFAIWTNMADIDGDNDLDIVGARYFAGNIVWYENQLPDSVWPSTSIATLPGTAVGESIDMDGDSDLDIVTHSNASNVLNWYKNPSWEATTITGGVSEIWLGPLGDIDKDGDLDVTFGGTNDIGWCQNLGDAENWQRYIFDTVANGYPFSADLADINSDTYLDITAYTLNFPNMTEDSRWYANPLALPGIIRVPEDYPTIQAGIDASSDGDTVLVADSTYYENIDFTGKAITVASYYLLDGDTNHINNTVIDGSQPDHPDSGSVVYFVSREDTNSVLCGFTIKGGTGTVWTNQDIWRSGGGVFCLGALGATIIDNQITQNSVSSDFVSGGGVEFFGDHTFFILERNRIFGNRSSGNNSAYSGGADFWGNGMYARIVENIFEQDTVVTQGFAAGGAIWLGPQSEDSLAGGLIQGNIFRENIVEGAAENAVGGAVFLAATMPMTISENTFEDNIAKSTNARAGGGALLIVDDPLLSNRKMVSQNQFVNNLSSSRFGDGSGGGIELVNTLATASGNYFEQNTAQGGSSLGGAIRIFQSAFRLENNIFSENMALRGGAVYVSDPPQSGTAMDIINNLIINNSAGSGGGIGIVSPNVSTNPERESPGTVYSGAFRGRSNLFLDQTDRAISKTQIITQPQIINNTISGNTAQLGGGIYTSDAQILLMNSILWGDSALAGPEIYVNSDTITVRYSDIQGGWTGEGNIDVNPFFAGTIEYELSDSSLCIGAGIDSIDIGGVWYYAPPIDVGGNPRPNPAGTMPDMGAWESASGPVGIETEDFGGIPLSYSLDPNYPNPFNPSTTIEFALPEVAEVGLTIYNALGQQVAKLFQGKLSAGRHRYTWQANELPSGVYFYSLSSKEFTQTRKMLLLR